MNNRYLYQVGDEVVHDHHTLIKGTITELLTENEGEHDHRLDPSNPWYLIKWDDPSGEWIGFEHEYSLLPGFCNPIPSEFIGRMCKRDKELWKGLVDEIRKDMK